jgi:hypothetical protein
MITGQLITKIRESMSSYLFALVLLLSIRQSCPAQEIVSTEFCEIQSSPESHAQNTDNIKFAYGSIGFGNGNGRSFNLGLNICTSKFLYFNTALNVISYKPSNQPGNYNSEHFI